MSVSSEIHVGRYRLRCCRTLRLLYNCYMQWALNISRTYCNSVTRIPSVYKLVLFIYQLVRRRRAPSRVIVLFVRDLAQYLWVRLYPEEAFSLKVPLINMCAVQDVTSWFNRHVHNDVTT